MALLLTEDLGEEEVVGGGGGGGGLVWEPFTDIDDDEHDSFSFHKNDKLLPLWEQVCCFKTWSSSSSSSSPTPNLGNGIKILPSKLSNFFGWKWL